MVLVSSKAPTRKGTPRYPLDQVPELLLPGDNHADQLSRVSDVAR
jgi:hypothetical protein